MSPCVSDGEWAGRDEKRERERKRVNERKRERKGEKGSKKWVNKHIGGLVYQLFFLGSLYQVLLHHCMTE